MRSEHETRLEALAEKLADVFLEEADPAIWNGVGVPPKDRSKEERGDRNWDLKNANQLGLLFARALELQARARWARVAAEGGDEPTPGNGNIGTVDVESEMKRFEGEAVRLLEKVGTRVRK